MIEEIDKILAEANQTREDAEATRLKALGLERIPTTPTEVVELLFGKDSDVEKLRRQRLREQQHAQTEHQRRERERRERLRSKAIMVGLNNRGSELAAEMDRLRELAQRAEENMRNIADLLHDDPPE